ncbi:hypothetical protein [Sphingosinithalassobacter portus]|uniref:hypothetical protein n=1 Tax=Stakelama portus TaxID=2676234 RepID=UPI0011AB8238|nr:hypothetical protein [Sphingosinithalassobacter portus]
MRQILFMAPALLALTVAAPAMAQDKSARELGVETTIPFADSNGIRNWEVGPVGSNDLYVQDSRRDWYRVQIAGPCMTNPSSFQLVYKTGPMGSFDTQTKVASSDFPGQWCSVISVQTSAPPPGHRDRNGAQPETQKESDSE